MTQLQQYIVHELAKLVAIPSVTGSEMPCIVYLEHHLAEMGLHPFRQQIDKHRANLVLPAKKRPAVLLTAHVDTVPDFGHPELFVPRIENGWLRGRGAADVKGGVVAILGAIRCALAEGTPLEHVAVAFTVDEERGGTGSEALAEAIEADAAIVMEPTRLSVCHVAAGSIEMEFVVPGYACHGSEFEAGTNAIEKAIALLQSLAKAFRGRRNHPALGEAGFNVMAFNGGSDALRVPDECRVHIDLRMFPGDDPDELIARLQQLGAMHDARPRVLDVSGGFELAKDAPVVRLLAAAFRAATGRDAVLAGIKSWTDAEPLVRHGIPAVVFGPGDLRDAHTEREAVRLDDVVTAVNVLHEVIKQAARVLTAPS